MSKYVFKKNVWIPIFRFDRVRTTPHSDPCAKWQTNQLNQTVEQQAEGSGGRVRQRMLMDDEGGVEAFSLKGQ